MSEVHSPYLLNIIILDSYEEKKFVSGKVPILVRSFNTER